MLILCTGNSARSQMAEAWLRYLGGSAYAAFSAGTYPTSVNPLAIQVMAECQIDISQARSKSVTEFLDQPFDYVITVCDQAAEQCPIFPGNAKRLHWSFPDPAAVTGNFADRLQAFRNVRDGLYFQFWQWITDRLSMEDQQEQSKARGVRVMRLLIIGGSDAGISAALRARELARDVQVTVVVADAYPNFSICGLPYYLSGDVPEWHSLAHRTRARLRVAASRFCSIHWPPRSIRSENGTGTAHPPVQLVRAESRAEAATLERASRLPYDRLIIATGARPRIPAITGLDQDGVYLLHTMDHSFALHRHLVEQRRSAR